MSDEEKKIEINADILKEIFKIAKVNPPKDITDEALLDAVFKIKQPQTSNVQETETYNPTSNNILVIDKEVYTFYKNSKFKDYEILYSNCIPKNYSFMVIAEEENFYEMFNYTVSTNSYYRYRNTALMDLNNDSIIKANSFEELYIVILILILVPVLFFIAIYLRERA